MQKSSKEALESINHELLQSILYENNLPSKKKKKTKEGSLLQFVKRNEIVDGEKAAEK